MIAIVDTGGANIASVKNALDRLGRPSELTSDPDLITRASHVLLPGVGAAGDSMEKLRRLELIDCLKRLSQPTLGICLGMQILFAASEEDEALCLGILPGKVRRIPNRQGLAVPHMGWNGIELKKRTSPILKDIPQRNFFYFVHSFVAPPGDWVSASFDYGGEYPAMIESGNFFGAQFHPEKSGAIGSRILRNFLAL